MQENNGVQKTRKELHMNFGGVLGRCYRAFENSNSVYEHKDYIYENDEEMKERFDRFEELEWEEQYKKKCQKMLDEKNK